MNIRFCKNNFSYSDNVSVLLDLIIFDFSTSIFLSISWMLTTLSSIGIKACAYELFIFTNLNPFKEIIYPLCICQIIEVVMVYLNERKYKQIFINCK